MRRERGGEGDGKGRDTWKLLLLQTAINSCYPLTAIIAIAPVRWELAHLCPSSHFGVVCDTTVDHEEMCDHVHPRCCLEWKPKQHFGTVSRCSAVIVPPAQASWSVQRCVRSICLWLETRAHGFRHGSVFTRKLCRLWAMPSTWDLHVCEDFITEIARAGGEEISPRDRFGAQPIRKSCLSNTAIEALQSHKTLKGFCINFKWFAEAPPFKATSDTLLRISSIQPLRFESRGVCKNVYIQWSTAVTQSSHSLYLHASLPGKICAPCICYTAFRYSLPNRNVFLENGRWGERAKSFSPGSDDAQTNFRFARRCIWSTAPVHRDPEDQAASVWT